MYAIILLGIAARCAGLALQPDNKEYFEYEYSMQRNVLEDGERHFQKIPGDLTMNETIVDNYLEYLKWVEFNVTETAFPPSRPIEDVLDQIKSSKVYKVLKKFPKGGNLHLHQNHILPKRKMLELIFNSSLLDVLCVNVEDSNSMWKLGFFLTPPQGWVNVKQNTSYSIDKLLQQITFINTLPGDAKAFPTNSGLRWKYLGPMFGKAGTELVLYQNYTRLHMQALFKHCLEENVQYLETRATGAGMYVLDNSVTNGHRLVDNSTDGDLWFQTIIEEVNKFKRDHPDFIGYKEIYQGKRYESAEKVMESLESALRLRQKYPDMLTGFDLVSEEDQGYSLLFFVEDFAELAAQNRSIPVYFHTAETNWPSDLMSSDHPMDPVSTLDNVYEAIILGSKRVGHGLGFIKHPYLLQILKERRIAIELNPVSNMLLGYVTDQRHHPGATYLRYGIPVVLAADDPGTMGYDEFTVDWYEAFMAWGLRLSDMRALALNSLNYSTMSVSEKQQAMVKYQMSWNTFILDMAEEACSASRKYSAPEPEVHSIFPKAVPVSSNATVRVFGRNFQWAICETIICRFGNRETHGRYVYNYMIICPTPESISVPSSVDFSISLNSGKTFTAPMNSTFSSLDSNTRLSSIATDNWSFVNCSIILAILIAYVF